MPPSLYLRNLRTLSGALSIPNSQRFILAPLSLGRGNRLVDAAFRSRLNMEKGTYSWIQVTIPSNASEGLRA